MGCWNNQTISIKGADLGTECLMYSCIVVLALMLKKKSQGQWSFERSIDELFTNLANVHICAKNP